MEHYLGILAKSIFMENMALAFFLGMCSFMACSKKVDTAIGQLVNEAVAAGLGIAGLIMLVLD